MLGHSQSLPAGAVAPPAAVTRPAQSGHEQARRTGRLGVR
jgi:hypothetical protein